MMYRAFANKFTHKLPRLKGELKSFLPIVKSIKNRLIDKDKGQPCEQGETAASSGCIPASGVGGQKPSSKKPDGKVDDKPEATTSVVNSKAFKNWFGDWENDPKKASKVVDENGKPLKVYHGTSKSFDAFKTGTKNAWSEALGFDTYFFSEGKTVASTYANQRNDGKLLEVYLNIKKPLEIDARGGEWIDAISDAMDGIQTYRTPEEKEFLDLRSAYFDKYAYELEYDPDSIPEEETEKLKEASRKVDRHILANKRLYQEAKRQPYGYDGIIVKNVLDVTDAEPDVDTTGSYNPYTTVYVAFKPNQIKAADNEGAFNPADGRMRKSLRESSMQKHLYNRLSMKGELKSFLPIRKDGGTCKPGQRADLTHCVPASFLPAKPTTAVANAITGETVANALAGPLAKATHLSASQKQDYARAVKTVVAKMTNKSLNRLAATVKRVAYHADAAILTNKVAIRNPDVMQWLKEQERRTGKKMVIKGCYDRKEKKLDLNGPGTLNGVASGTEHFYAHELSHALDAGQFSSGPEWTSAWEQEIKGDKVSAMANLSPSEGWAEFGRLLLVGGLNKSAIQKQYPLSSTVWSSHGFWPEDTIQTKGIETDSDYELPAIFNGVYVDTDGSIYDVAEKESTVISDIITKDEGQPCEQGETAARSGCIPADGASTSAPARQNKPVKRTGKKPRPIRTEMFEARREGKGKQARVVMADGSKAPKFITPAMIGHDWTNVRISKDKNADVYVEALKPKKKGSSVMVSAVTYSDNWTMKTAAYKFAKIHNGLDQYEKMSQQVQNARRKSELKDDADCAWLMMEQGTRPGSEADNKGVSQYFGLALTPENVVVGEPNKKGESSVALKIGEKLIPLRDKKTKAELIRRVESGEPLFDSTYWLKSYGATTLEGRHVVEKEDGVYLQFVGKETVWHNHKIRDASLAKMLLERKNRSGSDGKLFDESDDYRVGRFVRKLDGGKFTPKDLRTMRGTREAIDVINRMETPTNEKEYKAKVMEVGSTVCRLLGNDPAMALKAYIAPDVFSSWLVHVNMATS